MWHYVYWTDAWFISWAFFSWCNWDLPTSVSLQNDTVFMILAVTEKSFLPTTYWLDIGGTRQTFISLQKTFRERTKTKKDTEKSLLFFSIRMKRHHDGGATMQIYFPTTMFNFTLCPSEFVKCIFLVVSVTNTSFVDGPIDKCSPRGDVETSKLMGDLFFTHAIHSRKRFSVTSHCVSSLFSSPQFSRSMVCVFTLLFLSQYDIDRGARF